MSRNPWGARPDPKKRVITVSVTAAQDDDFERMKAELDLPTDSAAVKRGLKMLHVHLGYVPASQNPILLKIMEDWDSGDSFAEIAENLADDDALAEFFPFATPEHIAQARKVASDFAALAARTLPESVPFLTEAQVWAIAKAEHDYVGDRDNVPAFVASLTGSLRNASVAFDEQPFVDAGYLHGPARPLPETEEWEYACHSALGHEVMSLSRARSMVAKWDRPDQNRRYRVVCRHPAGPWLPIPESGESDHA